MSATRIGVILAIIAVLIVGGVLYKQNTPSDESGLLSSKVPAPGVNPNDIDEMIVGDDAMMDDGDHMDDGTMMEEGEGMTEGGDSMMEESPKTVVISYTDQGFEPKEVTINAGDTVTFRKDGSRSMWPASAQHPSHTVYSGTTLQEHCFSNPNPEAFDSCSNVETYSFTFTKTGTWFYHNHSLSSHFGSVIVK